MSALNDEHQGTEIFVELIVSCSQLYSSCTTNPESLNDMQLGSNSN